MPLNVILLKIVAPLNVGEKLNYKLMYNLSALTYPIRNILTFSVATGAQNYDYFFSNFSDSGVSTIHVNGRKATVNRAVDGSTCPH